MVCVRTDEHSRTALIAAFFRAQHHLHDEPKLIDDPYAQRLLTAAEMAVITQRYLRDGLELGVAGEDPALLLARTLRTMTPAAFVLARARYTEDRLAMAVERGVGQYVLVGAGFDTFAFRGGNLRDRVQVFEIDHPRSQAVKRERLAAAGLADPPNLHFAAVDFERDSIVEALERVPFRPDLPAVFAWLGVTMYLTRAAIEAMWRSLRGVAAAGSELVFDFIHPPALSETASARVQRVRKRRQAAGEAIITALEPGSLRSELGATGWVLIEHLDAAEIQQRWFATRTDGYVVGPLGHLACAGAA